MRLSEKSQNNISKRAAVEKEPLTLEKDQEDQHLSKATCFRYESENRDINVVNGQTFQVLVR